MNQILTRNLFRRIPLSRLFCTEMEEVIQLDYNLDEDIISTQYRKTLILGINLPDVSNSLDDAALIKLNDKLKNFNSKDDYSVAVLHGVGGNFCTGIQKSVKSENAENLINTMSSLKKPTIANLTGFTTLFGFQIAMMCDFRVMETKAILGLGHKVEKDELYPIVLERLIAFSGVVAALDVVLSGCPLSYVECRTFGLISRSYECGAGLGSALKFAGAIAKYPLEDIIKNRELIYSFMPKSRVKLK